MWGARANVKAKAEQQIPLLRCGMTTKRTGSGKSSNNDFREGLEGSKVGVGGGGVVAARGDEVGDVF
jgi:hypothetical protein